MNHEQWWIWYDEPTRSWATLFLDNFLYEWMSLSIFSVVKHTHIAKNMQGPLRTLFGLYTSDFSCLLSELIKDELNTNLLVQHIGSPFCLAWPPMVFINRCQLHHILDTLPKNSWLVPSPTKERIISELGLSQHRVSPIPMHYNL